MRVVIVGATGNVGTSLVRALARERRIREIVGVARRLPDGWEAPKTRWVAADIARDPLDRALAGAEAVVHLAWAIQPSHDEAALARVNLDGSRRVFEAALRAGASTLVHASSVGAYSPGPKDRAVDESHPTGGIRSSFYSRHKAAVERMLDEVEAADARLRVVRMRPALIFKAEAAQEIRRLFAGPLLPSVLLRPALVRAVPRMPRLRIQAVHTEDVADAYVRALLDPAARGAYNVAAHPVIDADTLAREFGAVQVSLRAGVVRRLIELSWRARLQPTPPGWLDMGLGVPVMDSTRVRSELGWLPRRSSMQALRELLTGISTLAGGPTPPLAADAGGPLRVREVLTGVGGGAP